MNENSTRDRILDVSEKLFSDNGFEGTSLRAITAEAQVNLAAVHYHFGSKHHLLCETMRRRIEPVNRERLRRLDAAIERAGGGTPPVEEIVDAFVRPAVEMLSVIDRRQISGMIRLVHDERTAPEFICELFCAVRERFQILGQALPHLQPEEVVWRFHLMVGSMIQAFGTNVFDSDSRLGALDADANADLIVAWAIGGMKAAPALSAPDSSPQTEETSA